MLPDQLLLQNPEWQNEHEAEWGKLKSAFTDFSLSFCFFTFHIFCILDEVLGAACKINA